MEEIHQVQEEECAGDFPAMLRPRPVPRPTSLVVKNGSNARATELLGELGDYELLEEVGRGACFSVQEVSR